MIDSPYLHPDNSVDEEEHCNEQDDIWKSLERLDERPEQDPDGVALPEKLDQTGRSEQPEKAHVDEVSLVEGKNNRNMI